LPWPRGAPTIITADDLRTVYTVATPLFRSDASAFERGGGINVRGTIRCAQSARQIGYFNRRFLFTREQWHADHQEFFITDNAFKRHGIGRWMFGRAVNYYAKNGIAKISLDAVLDGRYMWLSYGFKPEPSMVRQVHVAIRRAYKKASRGKEISASVRLPTRGIPILDYRYRGIQAGKLAVDQMEAIPLTMDLTNLPVRLGLIGRGWLEPWRLWG